MKTTLGQAVNFRAMQLAKGATEQQVSVRVDVIQDGKGYFAMKVIVFHIFFLIIHPT